ncbi:MAG: 5'-nucleotidase C-terminal domain-containing protein [Dehalococcoidia bacterium]|nr:5'-nucleotidase C-terminal domain-containing protein [Dehalococcoidia bacterium]
MMLKKQVIVCAIFTIIAAAFVSCAGVASMTGAEAPCAPVEITVLHINDTHAHLEDVARRATLVKKVRDEVGTDKVLMFDSGDVFMGTPYFSLMKGQADLEFMNSLGYDAMTLGNHEFDNYEKTPQYLNDFVAKAGFPIVCSNIDFSKVPELSGKTVPYLIVEKNGQKFGVIGLLTEDTSEISDPGKNIPISLHVAAARRSVSLLQSKGINKIIALTHIGWDYDTELARQVGGIDLIIGGHSHTKPDVYPTVIENKEPTLVVQAEAYGKYLGRLDIAFDKNGVIVKQSGSLYTIKEAAEDAEFAAMLAKYNAPIERLQKTIVGKTLVDLDAERTHIRTEETNFGNLVADAMLAKSAPVKANIAIANGGAIRITIPAGDISLGQLQTAIPFNNDMVVFNLSGEDLVAALENGVSKVEDVEGRFPQVAGMKFDWDYNNEPGTRVRSVEVKTAEGYQPLDRSATYRIVTNRYMQEGGDGYTVFQKGMNVEYPGFVDYDVVREYIERNSPVNPAVEGRITTQ